MMICSPRLLLLFCTLLLLFPCAASAQFGGNPTGNDPLARVQFIHNIPDAGPIDVYLNNVLWLDDFDFRTATPFELLLGGTYKLDIVAGTDSTNSTPLRTDQRTFNREEYYIIAAQGRAFSPRLTVRENARGASFSGDAEFFFIHGSPDTGPLDIRLRDHAKGNALVSQGFVNNIAFGETSIYLRLVPAEYNFEVTNADNSRVFAVFHFNLNDFAGRTFVLLSSGLGMSPGEGFSLIGYDATGTQIASNISTTATEDASEVPETFALAPNYPNPFNPSTALAYALPRPASVRLTVYDALGRHVRTLVEAEQPAGSYTVRWDGHDDAGRPVPSGVYLYRIIAGDFVQARTMLLVK